MIPPESGRRYFNPWVAGVALGVLVTAAFGSGHYFGASRVFATLGRWLARGGGGLGHWMTYELIGLFAGAFVGSLVARRFGLRVTRGERVSARSRVVLGVLGGALVMLGSRFAAGCTSGLALTGGARMSAGAYVFTASVFAGGFFTAAVARRVWAK